MRETLHDSPQRSGEVASIGPAVERALVERIAEGDESAFERLFRAYYHPLCDFCAQYRLGAEASEEIVQTVLWKIWERRRTWDPRGGVRAYLFGACRNAALDLVRHEHIVRSVEDAARMTEDVPGLGHSPDPPDHAVAARELSDAVRRAVESLPERRRTVVILRWQYQMGPSEIARVLGITVKGVESNLSRALADLREQLGQFR
jgi:RNA polymerase sigma-70 factor (ECF subfamily)